MYAASIVEQRLTIAREELGFQLEYHSPSDITNFNSNLEKKYADEYSAANSESQGKEDSVKTFRISLLRSLSDPRNPRLNKDEVRFIQNERALIMCDAAYFLTRYYWIFDEENLRRLFKFRAGQRVIFDVIAEMETRGIAIEIILAKARQLGMTTVVAGLLLLKVMFSEGVSGIIASADTGKTREMVGKVFFAYDALPWWLPPLTTRRVESENGLIAFVGDSRLVFQHGKQTNPIAMGSTPVAYHLSEVSSYPNAENLIEVGLFKCVHPSTRVFGVLESTCKGDTGWWYDTYWNSKRAWASGGSRLMALFLPFCCDSDMYPNPTWLRKSPLPRNWKPMQETSQMKAECEMYIQSNPMLDKVLRAKQGTPGTWHMPPEQAWYWEQNFKEHRSKGAEKTWYQEMPHTDDVAFQGSYDNVFGRDTIAEVWSTRTTAYHVYAIVGQSIEDRFDPAKDDLDLDEQIIPVAYKNITGTTYRWELWPLKWKEPFRTLQDIRDEEDHMGKFFVWHPPEPGYDYSIGVDTSNGIGSDSTVIAVARRGRTPQEQDIQVAEFRSNEVSHVEAFAWCLAIAAYYARYMDDSTRYREPYVSVEQIMAVGDTCQLQMRKMGYKRFHKMIRYDSTPKQMRKSKSNKVGWFTSGWSRPMLTDGFVTLVKNNWYKVNSPYTMREMTQWEVHYTAAGKDKYEHSEDATDDGIFANAMAAFCPNDVSVMAARSTKQYTGLGRKILPELDLRTTSGIVVSTDADFGEFRV